MPINSCTNKDCQEHIPDLHNYFLRELQNGFINVLKVVIFTRVSLQKKSFVPNDIAKVKKLYEVVKQDLASLSNLTKISEHFGTEFSSISQALNSKISGCVDHKTMVAVQANVEKASDFFQKYPDLILLAYTALGNNSNLTELVDSLLNMWNKIELGQKFIDNTGMQKEFWASFTTTVSKLNDLIGGDFLTI